MVGRAGNDEDDLLPAEAAEAFVGQRWWDPVGAALYDAEHAVVVKDLCADDGRRTYTLVWKAGQTVGRRPLTRGVAARLIPWAQRPMQSPGADVAAQGHVRITVSGHLDVPAPLADHAHFKRCLEGNRDAVAAFLAAYLDEIITESGGLDSIVGRAVWRGK